MHRAYGPRGRACQSRPGPGLRQGSPARVSPRGVPSAPDRTGPRAPRIRDVAERAGVGVGTVSRVLNDSPEVATATRERVRAVMDELGYRPSSTARNLSLGRTQTLGVIAPFFTSPSVVERLRGIDDVVGATAYDLALFNIETRDQRRTALRRLARHDRVDGVLIISLPPTGVEVRALSRDGVPAVLIDVADDVLPHVAIATSPSLATSRMRRSASPPASDVCRASAPRCTMRVSSCRPATSGADRSDARPPGV
jgi:hypothetical protein